MHAYQPERLAPQPKAKNPFAALFSQHPALFSGAAMSLAVMGAIFVNAVWYQPASHPSPMFSTRTLKAPQTVASIEKAEPAQSTRTSTRITAASPEVMREVQSALAVRGYYEGKVDGKFGSRTKKAIVSFQRDHSLDQDGTPSVRLLSQILLSASATPEEVPVPSSQKIASAPTKVKTIKIGTQGATEDTSEMVALIQAALRRYGYEELVVDGKPGKKTKSAIQSFQLDYGMKITGEASQSVLNKLREIGAVKQG